MFLKNKHSAERSQYILQNQDISIDSALPTNAQTTFNFPDCSKDALYNCPFLLRPKSSPGSPVVFSFHASILMDLQCGAIPQFFLVFSYLTLLKNTNLLLGWMTLNLWLAYTSSRLRWGHTFLAGITLTRCCVLLSGSYWGYHMQFAPLFRILILPCG